MALKLVMVLALSAFAIGGKLSRQPSLSPRVRGQPPITFLPQPLELSKPEETKIVGGQEAARDAWPWYAFLEIRKSSSWYMCGGSLVAANWVVTAAHCVKDAISIRVRLGIHDRTVQGPNEQRQEVAVDATHVFKHNSYNPRTYSHDIAMLKLPMNFQLNNHVNVIQLPGLNAGNVAAGTNCMVIGFGETRAMMGRDASNVLMQLSVPIASRATCRRVYAQTTSPFDESMICAGNGQGGRDVCSGDSGGPLMCQANGVYLLEGAVSFGVRCARPAFYGVYANVRFFRQWIANTMRDNP